MELAVQGKQSAWRFLLSWWCLTIIGWAIGWGLGWGEMFASGPWFARMAPFLVEGIMLSILPGALMGAGMGLGQWLLLRTRLPRAGWWILISVVGWAVGWTAGLLLMALGWGSFYDFEAAFGTVMSPEAGMVVGAVGGVLIGLGQWLLLRGRLPRAIWWVLISALAWTIGWTLAGVLTASTGWPALANAVAVTVGAIGSGVPLTVD